MKDKTFNHNTKNFLKSWGKDIVIRAKANLAAGGKGGGKLMSSIGYKLKETPKGFVIEFQMEKYGKFQDKGVKGAGGTIKTGKHEGSWGGRRHYQTWQGVRKDSPYKFGSGKSSGSIYKGIEGFIKKKGIKGRSSITGRYITQKSLEYAMVKVLWIKGMHGISFFQKSLQAGMKKFDDKLGNAIVEDILDSLRDAGKQK
jgi:hypothetical protein